ncbi:MAG: hypothetical protein ACPLYD_14365 [Anaerolineae bacterium]
MLLFGQLLGSGRSITDGDQPDKAITVLNEACARRRLSIGLTQSGDCFGTLCLPRNLRKR